MNKVLIIGSIVAVSALGSYLYIQKKTDMKKNVNENNITAVSNVDTSAPAKPILDPTVDDQNDYILEQISALDFDSSSPIGISPELEKSLNEVQTKAVGATSRETSVIEANIDAIASALEVPKFDDSESDEELITRLARQTGMSEQELRDAFKGQQKD